MEPYRLLGGFLAVLALMSGSVKSAEPIHEGNNSIFWIINSLAKSNRLFFLSSEKLSNQKILSGKITYRQRIALLPGSVVEVRVENTTQTDTSAPAALLSSTRFEPAGQVPIPFEIELPESGTGTPATYAVSAQIYGPDGRLLFVSQGVHRVSAAAATNQVELMLVPSEHGPAAPTGRVPG
jgi:putative lipoprotein